MKRDNDADLLAERFEAARPRLQSIAHRILGSAAESEDALQESWLRISRADTQTVANFDGWLTTVVARVCLDSLKKRESRREDLTPEDPRAELVAFAAGEHPEEEAVLADSIGVALLVLLDSLGPAERVAFVLHDMFDVPFEDIAGIVGRTTEAARQLASRARRRIRGASPARDTATRRHDELVRAFFAASRAGNFTALLALLDPKATLRADAQVVTIGAAPTTRGAGEIARTFVERWQGARGVPRTSGRRTRCRMAAQRAPDRAFPLRDRRRSNHGNRSTGRLRYARARRCGALMRTVHRCRLARQ
jgi:RNA polymerase sigma factor (sigma-70 family)